MIFLYYKLVLHHDPTAEVPGMIGPPNSFTSP